MKNLRLRLTANGWQVTVALLLLPGLVHYAHAQPTQRNTGQYINAGSSYHATAFVNLGTVTNTGAFASVNTFAGLGVAFSNAGPYAFAAGGANPVTDQFTGAGAQTLAGTVAPQFFNLTLANVSTSTFAVANAQGLDVAGTLLLSNGLTTTTGAAAPPTTAGDVAGAIRLGPTATLAGVFGPATYIDGFVGKAGATPFSYPLGATPTGTVGAGGASPTGSPLYSPITLSNPAGTTLRYVAGASAPPSRNSLAAQGGGLQLTAVSSKEYYPLYAPAGGGLNTSITLPYTNFGPAGYVGSPAQLTIAGFDGTRWVNLSTAPTNSFTATTVTVTVPAGTDLSPYQALALASTSAANPLPVELVSFTATKQQADGLLRWTTASELHADRFDVQASADGKAWQTLGYVQAAGNSSTARNYTYVDHGVARYGAAAVYYRLRQVDLNATSRFSPVCSLLADAPAWALTAYPNPFAQDLGAQLTSDEAGPIALTLLDAAGRTVLRQQAAGQPGTQVIALAGAALPAGAYVLRVQQNGHTGTVRVVHR